MSNTVLIQGDGMAACCCAALLSRAGWQVIASPRPRNVAPHLMLSSQTQSLLSDVFGGDFLAGAIPIRQRVVLWGTSEQPVALPHAGLVMAESTLLQRVWSQLEITSQSSENAPAWNVISSAQSLPPVSQHAFGFRIASAHSVVLCANVEPETCWVESVKNGWLFLIPSAEGSGSLIAVGLAADQLLAESRLIHRQIKELGPATGNFPAYPRIVKPLGGAGWLACGTAAIAFDPIAGEGTGHALREGILASAVIQAAADPKLEPDLLLHYTNRMLSGFQRHLEDCTRFYSIALSPWWESECELLQQGIQWAQSELASKPAGQFRLIGFQLHKNFDR